MPLICVFQKNRLAKQAFVPLRVCKLITLFSVRLWCVWILVVMVVMCPVGGFNQGGERGVKARCLWPIAPLHLSHRPPASTPVFLCCCRDRQTDMRDEQTGRDTPPSALNSNSHESHFDSFVTFNLVAVTEGLWAHETAALAACSEVIRCSKHMSELHQVINSDFLSLSGTQPLPSYLLYVVVGLSAGFAFDPVSLQPPLCLSRVLSLTVLQCVSAFQEVSPRCGC